QAFFFLTHFSRLATLEHIQDLLPKVISTLKPHSPHNIKFPSCPMHPEEIIHGETTASFWEILIEIPLQLDLLHGFKIVNQRTTTRCFASTQILEVNVFFYIALDSRFDKTRRLQIANDKDSETYFLAKILRAFRSMIIA